MTIVLLTLIAFVFTDKGDALSASNMPRIANDITQSNRITRRGFGILTTEAICAGGFLWPREASAAKDIQEGIDKENILKGYGRLSYLLENWEQETTICGKGGDNPYTGARGCDRTPLKVMDYLGYKSMKDPLFKADKTMRRLEELVPADKEAEYLEAVEKYSLAAEEASGMAFVSSWGEANPGGGKDRVELFIERSKKNVIDARESLATIIDILQLAAKP